MKKKSKISAPIIRRARLPKTALQYPVIKELSGGSRMPSLCVYGHTRMVRIGGRFKKRMWCRVNDLIIIEPWVVQSNEKADLVYRYLPAERNWLLRNNKVPTELNIW